VPGTDLQELHAAIRLLNSRGVHISTRGADGVRRPLDSLTAIALASVVRALDKAKGYSEDA
jgi:hypothetical protein